MPEDSFLRHGLFFMAARQSHLREPSCPMYPQKSSCRWHGEYHVSEQEAAAEGDERAGPQHGKTVEEI